MVAEVLEELLVLFWHVGSESLGLDDGLEALFVIGNRFWLVLGRIARLLQCLLGLETQITPRRHVHVSHHRQQVGILVQARCAAERGQLVGGDAVPLAIVVIVVNAGAGLAAHRLVDKLVVIRFDHILNLALTREFDHALALELLQQNANSKQHDAKHQRKEGVGDAAAAAEAVPAADRVASEEKHDEKECRAQDGE